LAKIGTNAANICAWTTCLDHQYGMVAGTPTSLGAAFI